MKRIYQHILNIISNLDSKNKYEDKVSVQRYEENEADNIGVVLFSSRNDEECISGETEWECLKLELYITCQNEADDIFDNLDFLKKFVDEFEKCDSTVDGLEIIWAKHLGAKARPSYTNSYGLQVVKTIIDFNYLLEDDN